MPDSNEVRDLTRDTNIVWIWLVALAAAVIIGVVFRVFSWPQPLLRSLVGIQAASAGRVKPRQRVGENGW